MKTFMGTVMASAAAVLLAAATAPAEPPQIVQQMIEAHGGMETWRSAPTVRFTDTWSHGLSTLVTVEQTTRRAYLEVPGSSARVTWDGERAWSENWEAQVPPRFLALLNYYFVNLPWLTMDPGVHLAEEGTATIGEDPTEYVAVRMTFDPGVGDTPDDYYLLYIDPETHLLHGCEYVVTYEAILPEGVAASPPHDLVFGDYSTVDGLRVPTQFTSYNKDGSVYASCDIWHWSFQEPFDETRMAMPDGAVVDESKP